MSNETVTPSSGCVFRDLELPNPDLLAAKSEILSGIRDQIGRGAVLLEDLDLTDVQAATITAGRLGDFTLDDLWRIGEKAGLSIGIDIEPS